MQDLCTGILGVLSLSTWPPRYGCRIIQRLLENCDTAKLAKVLDPIVASAGKLAKDERSTEPQTSKPAVMRPHSQRSNVN